MHADVNLDEPLPPELTGRAQIALLAYRRWPAYSAGWARQRARSVGLLITGAVVVLALALFAVDGPKPWGAALQVSLNVLVPLFGGPWIAAWARRRAARTGSVRLEVAAVAAALAVLLAGLAAFNEWGGEPMKQQLAEWTGDVDEQGQRRRVALAVGVFVRNLEQPDPLPQAGQLGQQARSTGSTLTTHVFMALLAFCLAGGLALTRPLRERDAMRTLAAERALAEAQRQRHEAEMRLSVLAAQVEPHFLFNTLAGVRGAIATDPARAAALIDRLADYLRASIPRLRDGGSAAATLGAQVELVRAYLALMAARMPRLRFRVEVADDLLALPFPPLMLVSLAENAVKHGVEPKVGPAEVVLRAERTPDGRLAVTVADDGAGFGASSAGTGLGLANIRERLQQMHGERAALQLRARPGGGVEATLTLPVE